MRYVGWLFICNILVSVQGISQTTPEDFLITAFEDRSLNEYQAQINFLNRGTYKIPFGDEFELRYGNDELSLEDVRYQLRFRPSNPWKVRRNNALFNARKDAITLRQSLVVKKLLFDRYLMLLKYISSKNATELSKKKYQLAQNKVQLYEQAVESDLFDGSGFIDAKLEVIELLEKYEDSKVKWNHATEKIKLILGKENIEWNDFTLISLEKMEETMYNLLTSSFFNTDLQYLQKQVEVAELETSTERFDFDLGFIQTEYAPFKNNGDNELGISVGVTLPIFKNNKNQIAEQKLDEIEQQNEFNAAVHQDSLNKVLKSSFLSSYLLHHKKLLKEINTLNLDSITKNLSVSENFNPLSLLKLEEGKIKLEEIVQISHHRLLKYYLEFLNAFDALQQKPLINYLSNDLNFIR